MRRPVRKLSGRCVISSRESARINVPNSSQPGVFPERDVASPVSSPLAVQWNPDLLYLPGPDVLLQAVGSAVAAQRPERVVTATMSCKYAHLVLSSGFPPVSRACIVTY